MCEGSHKGFGFRTLLKCLLMNHVLMLTTVSVDLLFSCCCYSLGSCWVFVCLFVFLFLCV